MTKHLLKFINTGLWCLVIVPISGISQSTIFAPVGATWRYNLSAENPEDYGSGQYRYVVTKDTVINGWNARVLQGEVWGNGTFVPNEEMTRYVATVGDKVYHKVDTSFVLLYDFGAQAGDTIFSAIDGIIPFELPCYNPPGFRFDFSYIIDAVSTTTVNGEILRTQWVKSNYIGGPDWTITGPAAGSINSRLIERVGAYPAATFFGGFIACIFDGYLPALRCYQDSAIFLEGYTLGLPCDTVVSTDVATFEQFRINPNPFRAEIGINLPHSNYKPIQFYLFDCTGRTVLSKNLIDGENLIYTRMLPPGFYGWEIRHENVRLGSGKLLKTTW